MSAIIQKLRHLYQERHTRLWVVPAVNSVFAVLLALLAALAPRLLPDVEFPAIDPDTLRSLLATIAASMLAVTTFSLSIMVSAFAAASSSATPRATELLMGDEGTRTAIGAFLSAFIFSVVAQIALGLGVYGNQGRFLLFLGTLLVLVYLIVTLVRWVRTLSLLGRFGNTVARIEAAARQSMQRHLQMPFMGATPGPEQEPAGIRVVANEVGYVRRIDMQALSGRAEACGGKIHVRVRPGALVAPGMTLAVVERGQASEPEPDDVRGAFAIAADRSFDQDPRFGLIVLSEVAQRALSPGINDPGSAIGVLNAIAHVLLSPSEPATQREQRTYPALTLVPLDESAIIQDAFGPIARDGAATLEVAIRLQKLLAMIVASDRLSVQLRRGARELAEQALQRSLEAMTFAPDRQALQEAVHLHRRA